MNRTSRIVRASSYVAPLVLVWLVPALYIGQNASNVTQVSGPTDIVLKTAAAKTTSTMGLTGGTQSITVTAGTAGLLAPGFNIVLDRGNSNQETDQPATPQGGPTGTCTSGATLTTAGTWCFRTDTSVAPDQFFVKPLNNHSSSGYTIEQLGSLIFQFQPSGLAPIALMTLLAGNSNSPALILGNATNQPLKLTANTDAGRAFGGGTSGVLALYGTQGGTGTSGLIQFRNNSTDEVTKVQIDTSTGNLTLNNSNSGSTVLTSAPTQTNTWTFQNATDTVVGRNTTDTLTNKTLQAASGSTLNINSSSGSPTLVLDPNGTIISSSGAGYAIHNAGSSQYYTIQGTVVSGGTPIPAGNAVCVDTAHNGDVAKCPGGVTSGIIGVAAAAISAGGTGDVVVLGQVTNASVTGTCGLGYWLIVSSTAGKLSCTQTFNGGTVVGIALSAGGSVMLVQPR